MTTQRVTSGRTGRRAGESDSRAVILEAARARFGSTGYDRATIRAIAGDAGVDPALVHHFFGNKEQLFVASMQLPVDPATVLPELMAPGPDGLGERLATMFVTLLRDPSSANPMLALLRTAAGHQQAAVMVREFYTSSVLNRVAAELNFDRPQLRAALCASQVMGLALAMNIVGLAPLVEIDEDALVAAYAPVLQYYLTGPLP